MLVVDENGNAIIKPIPLDTISKATVFDFILACREEEKATRTILNALTAWSHVMSYAEDGQWGAANPLEGYNRKKRVGVRQSDVEPPADSEVAELIAEVTDWSQDMANLIRWLRETGMRLAEALHLRAEDIHPGRTEATLKLGVKRNRGKDGGPKTRTIKLGRAAVMLEDMPKKGRLFPRLSTDSAIVSTRYGQWKRQKQGREDRAAKQEGREPVVFKTDLPAAR